MGAAREGTVDAVVVDAVVVGAGFGGLYAIHRLRRSGLSVQGFEAGGGVGGTWFWNRYPGARCDVESLEYSYQFDEELQQSWSWTERYAGQPEILAYADHVADRFDLKSNIQFSTKVAGASFDEGDHRWIVETENRDGVTATVRARFVVMATGGVSVPSYPDIDGLDDFEGVAVHTGSWPPEGLDVDGKRVVVIGNGGSGVQCLPELAKRAGHLSLLQRSPNYVVPARNRGADPSVRDAVKADYPGFRARNADLAFGFGGLFDQGDVATFTVTADERARRYEQRWGDGGYAFQYTFGDLATNPDAAETAAAFIRSKIGEIVDDPVTAAALTPHHAFGCRRIVIGTDFYETFNQPNVSLVDVSADPIVSFDATGVRTESGHVDADVIVFATGFLDQGASLKRIDLVGSEGESIGEAWADRPSTFLGLCTTGFPNLFFINGPGSPSITTNMIANIEHTVEWIVGCVEHTVGMGATRVEADASAQAQWTKHVDSLADGRLMHSCTSRYVGVTDDGEPYVFPYIGVPDYRERLSKVEADDYPGLLFTHETI